MPKILIIEDDTAFCQMLQKFLTKHGFAVSTSYSIKEAEEQLSTSIFDIILSDVRLPKGNGVTLLPQVKRESPTTQVILMTGYAEVKTAVNAMKKGAFDYISKPFTPEEILTVINNALNVAHTKEETPKKPSPSPKKLEQASFLVGESERSKKLQQYINLVAPTNMSVLLTGESGTGKEVTANAIHHASKRKGQSFVAVDCGAIPKEIATSEFFGHVKGSFTGAIEDKKGHFEAANGGTLFLDEVGNLSYEHQVQLLRAIQERKIKRVGSTKEIQLDLRIIAATNENLQEAVEEGSFREDLYHRLNEFSIEVPSLRERREDILLFANYFLDRANAELEKEVLEFSAEAKQILMDYPWPGNLREMKNMIKRAVLFTEGNTVLPSSLSEEVVNGTKGNNTPVFSKSEYEKERILDALRQTNFNKSKAAKLLQITRKTLYNKINQYQLEV
ncbi:two-component system, NtrC family, response regulator HydG [Flagellimonas taeanensis]|uniref:Two-component system, NtrC family, response regulator HydG n=1 Tax=Flagellimonas taeanensis TaxID=1005926 RepID=A0A1M6PMF6_9FLAO|nr:sigma-54 dependent transcriptional regulator [Allomuricauda taeanensis]SFB67215.1 two-component system, NtrC family, response regulator HydG [Allomuricauda taeanensis]SHK09121.1 two-component system, NtrC family, response regulator HydG [Allomuricauda taeanensis]